MPELKIYRCNHCGNIVVVVKDGKVTPHCCGEPMELIEAGAVDAAVEKHVPVVTVDGGKAHVVVGEVEHPMLEEHYIEWICVADGEQISVKYLKPGDKPEASFEAEHGVAYAYCNLHDLWKAEF